LLAGDHKRTGASYHNIANMYDSIGEYDKALSYYENALAIRLKTIGEDNPDTASDMCTRVWVTAIKH
jgi:tetratricopeptide (TPR) repeat protein